MKPIIINITDEGVHIPMELLKTNGFAQVLVVNKSSLALTPTPVVEDKPKRKKTTTPKLVSTPMPATTPEPTQSTLKKVVNEYLGKKK